MDYLVLARKRQFLRYARAETSHPYGLLIFCTSHPDNYQRFFIYKTVYNNIYLNN